MLEPGAGEGAAYFVPFAKSLVEKSPGWQVWSVERRKNLLEDQTMLNKGKRGLASGEEVFNYYLAYLLNPSIEHHYKFIQRGAAIGFAREWGMNVAVEDLHVAVEAAKALGGKVVLGGHGIGGSIATAYATWDFAGKPGADGISGLVYDDGGSSPEPLSREKAEAELKRIFEKSPWQAFDGVQSPFPGLFAALGSTGAVVGPGRSLPGGDLPVRPGQRDPEKLGRRTDTGHQ